MDRFSVIGVRFLVPLCLLFAGLLYIVLGLPYGRWWRFRELILNLTRVNLTLKYRGSFLGFCWSLLNPILMVVIYSIAFRYIMRIQLDNYTFFLISGLLPWNFLSMTLMSSTTSVLGNAGLLQKAAFPREVFPISTSLFVFVQFLLALVAIGPFCLMWKTDFVWINALYLVAVVALLVFSVGLAFLLSALTVIYRDVQHFTEVVVMALFWLTPIVYSFEHIPARFRWLFLLNPVTIFTNGFHDFIYWNRNPDAVTWIGILIWPLATLAVGALVFRRIDPRFAEVL
jgi:ABC-2 type transport system permease protein